MQKDVKAVIRTEQLKTLLAQSKKSILTGIGLALALVYFESDLIETTQILLWLIALLLLSIARFFVTHYYNRHPTSEPKQIIRRLNHLRLGLILSALMWAANASFNVDDQHISAYYFLSYIVAGMSSAVVVAYSIDRISSLSYVFLAVVPIAIKFLLMGQPTLVAMGLVGLSYAVFITHHALNFHHSFVENILLKLEAEKRDEEIKQMAFHDSLTGLPNRRLLQDRLQHALSMSKRINKGGAVLFIDLDNFKKLNDTQGHDMGDSLLKQVAYRLKGSVRDSDTVARLGGDEFVVMLENLNDETDIAKHQLNIITAKMLSALNKPYALEQGLHNITPSIGMAIFGKDGQSHDELLKNADLAMYQAKKVGGNVAKLFEKSMRLGTGKS